MAKKSWGGSRERSGRPPKYNGGTVPISLRVPGDLLEAIDSARGELSRNEYFVNAMQSYLRDRLRRQKRKGTR